MCDAWTGAVKIGGTTAPETAELLSWDTEFWGVKTALATRPDVDAWAAANTVGMLWLLVSADEPDRIQQAEDHNWRYMDTRVELFCEHPTSLIRRPFTRPATDDDIPALVGIARVSHRITRFYADPRLPDERCDDLYEAWIRNSYDGWAERVFVAEVGIAVGHTEPAGYVTVHVDGDTSSIGLIAVDERWRGKGIGDALVSHAQDWSVTQGMSMSVVTQGRNVAAQHLFQKRGFRTRRTDLWFHKWYDRA